MAKQLNVNLAFTADTSQAKAQLQSLQTQLSGLLNSTNGQSFGNQITGDINKASKAIAELKLHLKNATNVNTGNLDFTKLNESLNKSGKPVIIRQVIVPGIMDNDNYLLGLKEELKKITNIIKIEFLPYHELALEKYKNLGIKSPFEPLPVMDKNKCDELYNKFINEINKD